MPDPSFLHGFAKGFADIYSRGATQQYLQQSQQEEELRRQLLILGVKEGVPNIDPSMDTKTMMQIISGGITEKRSQEFNSMIEKATQLMGGDVGSGTPSASTAGEISGGMVPSQPSLTAPAPTPTTPTQPPEAAASSTPAAPSKLFERSTKARPKTSVTLKPGEGGSVTITSPGVEEEKFAVQQEALKADSAAAQEWLKANPHINAAFPGLMRAVQQVSPQALVQVKELQAHPYIQPREEDIMALYDTKLTPQQRFAKAMVMFGDVAKVNQALAQVGSGIDIKNLTDKEQSWAAILAAQKGIPVTQLPPDLAMQAKKNALAEVQHEAKMNSDMILSRSMAIQKSGANILVVAQTGRNLVSKLGDEAQLLAQGQNAVEQMRGYITRLVKTATGTRWFNKPLNEIIASGQLGTKGTDLAMLNNWQIPLAQLEERGLFKMGTRPGTQIIEKLATTFPNGGDKPEVMIQKLKRIESTFAQATKGWNVTRSSAITMLKSAGLNDAAKALNAGYDDIAKNLLEQAVITQPPTPAQDPSLWAPSTRK